MIHPRLLNSLMFVVAAVLCVFVCLGMVTSLTLETMTAAEKIVGALAGTGMFGFAFAAIKTASKEE